MRALHFGAGNIGRGLIGNLLTKTGYEVCFVDVNQQVVDQFNQNKKYKVELLDDDHTVEVISPVSALNSITQEEEVIDSIVSADLITTSVGINNLSRIAPILSKGLLKRFKINNKKVDIIANENAINATSTLKQEINKLVSPTEIQEISSMVGFPNSAIDRLSLSKITDEGNIALVEPFYEWIINKNEMVNLNVPPIKNAIYVDNLEPYIERKLYIVNLGHATTAYLGYLAGESTIQSTLKNSKIEQFVRETLYEASRYIKEKFNFNTKDLSSFIEKTLIRFKNENISDDVLRVGRSPIRKLSYNERLVKPTRELAEMGHSIDHLSVAIAAGFLFNPLDDEEAVELQAYIQKKGIDKALSHFSGLEDPKVKNQVKKNYKLLKTNCLSTLI
jgi:mannitol-1-phosphate 5-dehydrogenase